MVFSFPKDFMFGAASSACQIESGTHEGGKGEDCGDHFFALFPEKFLGADPNNSADFYYRYRSDILDMKELGLKAFRFSISWSRIYPNGPEYVCQAGIDYYNDMINALKEAGIIAFFDLFHCDLPYWVLERGGIYNPEFIGWFTTYAETCFKAFGDRVDYWSTVNEPAINIMQSYAEKANAPFLEDMNMAVVACHNMIIAHYKAVKLYKSMNLPGQIGAVNHVVPAYSQTNTPEDHEATARFSAFYYGWWLDPMLKGHYPKILMDNTYLTEKLPRDYQKELDENFVPMDFIGVNLYGPVLVRADKGDPLGYKASLNPDIPCDAYGFGCYPQGLYDAVVELHSEYPDKRIIITENGVCKQKWGNLEEERKDDYRIRYMREHLREVSRAISAGIPVDGYFCWSIMDTNEIYGGGFTHMFGLVQVDFETKERYRRDSWYYYQNVIASGIVD